MTYDDLEMPDNHIYLGCFDGDEILGFFWLIRENNIVLDTHINILKEHRHRAVELSKEFFLFMIEHFYGITHKLNCKIPTVYPEVIGHAKKMGFVEEGIDRQSMVKNGRLVDRIILGITMWEIKNEWCK